MTQRERGERFRALHAGEPFVIPNPWDAGSARALAALGFPALATTSSGFAFTLGRADGAVTLDELAGHVLAVCDAVDVPVSVDLENGFGPAPGDAAAAIARVAEAGAVGASIEDWDRDEGSLYGIEEAAARVAAAVEAARALPFPFTVTARAEGFVRGVPDLDDVIARLRAYEAAGADVLYAPRLDRLDQVAAIRAATGRPVNVLARPQWTVAEAVAAGAQRVSVGGLLAWVAYDALARAATRIRDDGDLSVLRAAPPPESWLA
ncbi:MAG: isocitrate lyase/phosphoenolpyruvate mutase family protein [Solirubrobacteraceae bacterium]|nr:isocitrate lyase/phosphoenolpyruvate mutase family protein [Solirubrobacteraceae bacterium]